MRQLAGDLRTIPLTLTLVTVLVGLLGGGPTGAEQAPADISFPTRDGGQIDAHLYGTGSRAVVLAHGKVFDKESWQPLAERLAKAGLLVLALDFRGYGHSSPGKEGNRIDLDVLAAFDYLEDRGVSSISVLGASMGGWAVASAATQVRPGRLDKVVLLAPGPIDEPQEMKAESFLYIASADEGGIERIKRQYELAPEPKRFELLPGTAHAQHVFSTAQASALTDAIVKELTR
jgi:pimeloyl-ACP methyl ester carboxylesterase